MLCFPDVDEQIADDLRSDIGYFYFRLDSPLDVTHSFCCEGTTTTTGNKARRGATTFLIISNNNYII